MIPPAILLGVVIGLSVAAPIGPINLLCIRRTLAHGPLLGFVSGLGSAMGHVIYSAVPALGLSAVSSLLVSHQDWIRLAGGAMLAYLGVTALASSVSHRDDATAGRGLLGAFGSACALTLSNPMTIVSFASAFAGLSLSAAQRDPLLFALGVFAGSAAWRGGLCLAASLVRTRLDARGLTWVNRGAGLALVGFGVLAAASALAARAT